MAEAALQTAHLWSGAPLSPTNGRETGVRRPKVRQIRSFRPTEQDIYVARTPMLGQVSAMCDLHKTARNQAAYNSGQNAQM